MRKTVTFLVTLIVAAIGLTAMAQAPQTGVYQIQNVGKSTYVKVTGKYDAELVNSQTEASNITVGIEKKLSDGSYKVNSLASTYGEENTPVEVYDYIPKALTLAEVKLREVLKNSSEENVQLAISRMHDLARDYGFMRMMPVEGHADTHHAIAVLPNIPEDIVAAWRAKVNYDGSMWEWCKELVIEYLDEHSGAGGTDSGLASRIRNNLANIQEGHTYMLTADSDGSFGYICTGESFNVDGSINPAALISDNNLSWWKLTPKVNNENVKDGTYKIRNIGNEKYVRIRGRYYATPDAEESAASDIRITFDGEANGGQKIVNLGGQDPNGNDIDIYSYIEKAIMIGKMAIYDVLTDGNGVNPASPENIAVAQDYLENEVKKGAFMCIKPVEDNDEAVYAYVTIPHIPEPVVTQMYQHHAITADSEELAWQFGVNKVKQYLNNHSGQGGTDNTLASYITANIDKIRPGVTYYLGAEANNTFDYYPKFDNANEGWGGLAIIDNFNDIKTNLLFQWGFDVIDVEEDNLTSGNYKIRNVQYENYVEVLSKYYAKPDTTEAGATEIHITYNGKLDDGSYKVTNMSAVAKDGSQVDLLNYVDKAIKLGKIAIADVLKGKSSDENIAYAQQYMEDFVRAAAFMRVKPVAGTNYVYAIATIPEIPYEVYHEMYRHGVITQDTKEAAWNYGVQYVLNYLRTHGTNSTLAQLITNNIGNIKQGHTYYLSEDSNHTFGYVDAENFSSTDKTIQWGIDLEEEDQPIESDFYKIHNVGNDTYVKVYPPYYAKPDQADEAKATPIAVAIGEQMPDGGYKITNLAGDGCDVQQYVQHAIELGEGVIDAVLNGVSSPANIAKAKQTMREFIEANAYMQIRQVPGETDAFYAYATAPVIPEEITSEWRKKVSTSDWPGDMWSWCVEKVKSYLDSHGTNSTLANLVLNNIDKIQEGHTYYLSAEDNGTFGYKDAAQMDFTDRDYWWGFADAIKAEPVSGYFRIKGADGKYVNVTGQFAAAPNLAADGAKTAAGSIIYIGTGETKNAKTLPIEILRSQGVDVGATSGYMFMITDVLKVVANKVAEIAEDKVQESSYSQYAGLIKPAVNTLLESVDLNLYIEPTLTSTGEEAYMLEVTTPNLAEYVDLANSALSLMGKKGADLVDNLEAMKKGDNGVMDKLISAAQEMVVMLDQPKTANGIADDIWALLKQKGKTFLSSYSQQLSALLPEQAITFVNNALNNPDFNYGTTYCLRQDADHTFGYASRETMADNNAAKWILEPFSEEAPNYDAEAYIPFVVETEFAQATITNEQNVGVTNVGDTYYFTTTYLDFDAKIETQNVKVYTVASTERVESHKNAVGDKPAQTLVYYIAKLKDVEGDYIPAATPVLLRAEDSEIQLRPINKPEHPAVESGELGALKDGLLEILINKIDGALTQNAPSPKAISQPATNNLLVGSFLGDEVEDSEANNYLELAQTSKIETPSEDNGYTALDMDGLGFWKTEDGLTKLKGNKAYMYGEGQTEFESTVLEESTVGNAPGYIFQYPDGDNTYTAIENVNATKEVKSVRYYNTLGIESTTPFQGVNIIVTTFTDGTHATTKAIK